jgi:hypothetical protein
MPWRLLNDAKHWRDRAEEARSNAELMIDPEAKRMMAPGSSARRKRTTVCCCLSLPMSDGYGLRSVTVSRAR